MAELRELLKKYKEEDLRLIITEMYKSMPKKLREDKDIDTLLQDVQAYLSVSKVEKRKEQADIRILKTEIERFVEYAYAQYYFAPNSVVHKTERPKWRFKVKSFIKDLQGITLDGEEGAIATDLLLKLYEMLCYGCSHTIFSTDDPFRSVGIEQEEIFDMLVSRKLGSGMNQESIKFCIKIMVDNVTGYYNDSGIIDMLIANLKTPDSKMIAIEQCKLMKKELDSPKAVKTKKSSYSYDSGSYKRECKINSLVEAVFKIHMELCEYDEAIEYFKKNTIQNNDEISLYVMLRILLIYGMKDLWLREYDEALTKGVKPRSGLQKTKEYILKNDALPEHIL